VTTVLVTPLAQEDLGDIWDYVAESGVERADRLLDLIHEKCQRLAEYPEMGRARHELLVNLRSFTVKNYVIFYQLTTCRRSASLSASDMRWPWAG
jgi:toxin ParE1/3/4